MKNKSYMLTCRCEKTLLVGINKIARQLKVNRSILIRTLLQYAVQDITVLQNNKEKAIAR